MADTTSSPMTRVFSAADLHELRLQIPLAVRRGQDRAVAAHDAWDDPDGDRHAYGAPMSRGSQKELRTALQALASYSEDRVQGTQRVIPRVDGQAVYLHRVGPTMPKNYGRLNMRRLSTSGLQRLETESYPVPKFESLFDGDPEPEEATFRDLMTVTDETRIGTLIVPYYNSTPENVGFMYWGKATLDGYYLEIESPERLRVPAHAGSMEKPVPKLRPGGFAASERPRTRIQLRQQTSEDIASDS